jgi:arabinofuranosyltransferase
MFARNESEQIPDQPVPAARFHPGRLLLAAGCLLILLVWLKNAWVCDDAYINFRVLDQLRAGHGPVWNPGERVQVYTSVLWFWLQAPLRLVSSDPYANVLVLSLVCLAALLVVLRRAVGSDRAWLLGVLLMVGANGFLDWTASGLENPLVFLACGLLLVPFQTVMAAAPGSLAAALPLRRLFVLAGWALLVRHDLLLLWLPPLLHAGIRHRRLWPWRAWLRLLATAAAPLAIWSAWALFYYGSPWPNAALAKLATGLPRDLLVQQGLDYLGCHRQDPVLLAVLAGGLGVMLARRSTRGLAAGLALHLGYLVWTGADFMLGRFLAAPFLIAVVLLVREAARLPGRIWSWTPHLAALLAAVLLPHTPLNSPLSFADEEFCHGVADERGYYFPTTSLWARLHTPADKFPDHEWAREGRYHSNRDRKLVGFVNVGFYGYFVGLDKRVTDRLAITEPFLARIPHQGIPDQWRPGHIKRDLPRGYNQTLQTGRNTIADGRLSALYDDLQLAISGPLLARGRLAAIWRLNTGRYRR